MTKEELKSKLEAISKDLCLNIGFNDHQLKIKSKNFRERKKAVENLIDDLKTTEQYLLSLIALLIDYKVNTILKNKQSSDFTSLISLIDNKQKTILLLLNKVRVTILNINYYCN